MSTYVTNLTQRVSAVIYETSPERIWDFASDSKNWTASNPVEHRGLELFTESGRPETGAMFHQQEYVAGVFADLEGHFLHVDRPRVCVWTGIAKYRFLGGLLRIRIAEGGTATLTSAGNGWELAHDVFMDYSDSLFGKLCIGALSICMTDREPCLNTQIEKSSIQNIPGGRVG